MSAHIESVRDLLQKDLRIPGYQRPYRWTEKNVSELLSDINDAVANSKKHDAYKYRIGSVILHRAEDGCFDIVDGQQRLLSLVLILLCLDPEVHCPLLDNASFSHRDTQRNMRANYELIADWMGYQTDGWRAEALEAFGKTLEAVVIEVESVEEAFQLFDSQNTRGRSLDPHDLLKAYHLRAMKDDPYGMRHAVTRWEGFSSDSVRDLFARYLFNVANWERKEKTHPFTSKDIDAYKGVAADSGYSYAARARRAAPCFQIGSPFIEGEDFFLMAEHYLELRGDIELGMKDNPAFDSLIKELNRKKVSTGLGYARQLFWCALFAYYDRFHNFDERVVRKLFVWAMTIRVDIQSLGFDTINKYAVGEYNDRYTNNVAMFWEIARARSHEDVANLLIRPRNEALPGSNGERVALCEVLNRLAGGGAR